MLAFGCCCDRCCFQILIRGMKLFMKEKKSHPVLITFLWICFITIVAIVVYLSFQNGEDTKAFGKKLIRYVAEKMYAGNQIGETEMFRATYLVRQGGRIVSFFLIGILGTVTIHLSFPRWNWLLKTALTASVLLLIACLTERLKVYIPGRHYSYKEMVYSILAVGAGFVLVTVFTLLFHIMKGFFRLLLTAGN